MPEPATEGIRDNFPAPFFDFVRGTKWLEENYFLKKSYGYRNFEEIPEQDKIEIIAKMQQAAVDELFELLGEMSWKPWASAQFLHREAALGEVVDALHFVGIIVGLLGFTDTQLSDAYIEKMERNRRRMIEGYTGLEKCTNCRRAFDDVDKNWVEYKGMRYWTAGGTICIPCAISLELTTRKAVLNGDD